MIIRKIEQLEIELPEIQDVLSENIIEAKLQSAFTYSNGPFIVEDISFTLDCLNGLPGPLIKWFIKTIGTEGLTQITEKFDNPNATVKAMIGYAANIKDIKFFSGEIRGTVVQEKGNRGFGFDSIFKPLGYTKTFAEMTLEEKSSISHRKIALEKLKDYLKIS